MKRHFIKDWAKEILAGKQENDFETACKNREKILQDVGEHVVTDIATPTPGKPAKVVKLPLYTDAPPTELLYERHLKLGIPKEIDKVEFEFKTPELWKKVKGKYSEYTFQLEVLVWDIALKVWIPYGAHEVTSYMADSVQPYKHGFTIERCDIQDSGIYVGSSKAPIYFQLVVRYPGSDKNHQNTTYLTSVNALLTDPDRV